MDAIAKICSCGRKFTEREWQGKRIFWGIRWKTLSVTLEYVNCDKCGRSITRRANESQPN